MTDVTALRAEWDRIQHFGPEQYMAATVGYVQKLLAALESDPPQLSVPVICPNCTHVFSVGAALEAPPDPTERLRAEKTREGLDEVATRVRGDNLALGHDDEVVRGGTYLERERVERIMLARSLVREEAPPEPLLVLLDDDASIDAHLDAERAGYEFTRVERRLIAEIRRLRGEAGPLPPSKDAMIAANVKEAASRLHAEIRLMEADGEFPTLVGDIRTLLMAVRGVVPAPPPGRPFVGLDQKPDGCWFACIASLTGIALDEFPAPPGPDGQSAVHNAVTKLLQAHGWQMHRLWDHEGAVPRGWAIAGGTSPRDLSHAVIVYDGVMVWDPHPSRAGLVTVESYEILVPVRAGNVLPVPAVPASQEGPPEPTKP